MISDILRAINGTFWLIQGSTIMPGICRLEKYDSCATAREVVGVRQKMLQYARNRAEKAFAPLGTEDHPQERELALDGRRKPIRASKGKIGVIPIRGLIQQRYSSEMIKLGGTSTEEVGIALDAMLAKDDIETIVFDIDSPGGTSYGVQELAEKIYAARSQKRTYAVANSLMASAAYWIGTAAETVVATPGGDVGSVGVYTVHVDESQRLEKEGLRVTLATAGKYKAEFASTAPLSPEAAERLAVMVQQCYDAFVSDLAKHRNVSREVVRESYGQGRVLSASEALNAGMVDRVMSLENLLARLAGHGGNDRKQAANDNGQRRRAFEHLRRKTKVDN